MCSSDLPPLAKPSAHKAIAFSSVSSVKLSLARRVDQDDTYEARKKADRRDDDRFRDLWSLVYYTDYYQQQTKAKQREFKRKARHGVCEDCKGNGFNEVRAEQKSIVAGKSIKMGVSKVSVLPVIGNHKNTTIEELKDRYMSLWSDIEVQLRQSGVPQGQPKFLEVEFNEVLDIDSMPLTKSQHFDRLPAHKPFVNKLNQQSYRLTDEEERKGRINTLNSNSNMSKSGHFGPLAENGKSLSASESNQNLPKTLRTNSKLNQNSEDPLPSLNLKKSSFTKQPTSEVQKTSFRVSESSKSIKSSIKTLDLSDPLGIIQKRAFEITHEANALLNSIETSASQTDQDENDLNSPNTKILNNLLDYLHIASRCIRGTSPKVREYFDGVYSIREINCYLLCPWEIGCYRIDGARGMASFTEMPKIFGAFDLLIRTALKGIAKFVESKELDQQAMQ